jgi:lysyl-tRNA synthetase class I
VFAVWCPRHGRRVLLGPSDIIGIDAASDAGFVIEYRCSCGHEGRFPATGGDGGGDARARMAG